MNEGVLDGRSSHQSTVSGRMVQTSGVGARLSNNPRNALWELVLRGEVLPESRLARSVQVS